MAKSFGNNVLPKPSSSWSMSGGAYVSGSTIVMQAGSTASITVTKLAENNILPSAIQLAVKARSYGSKYAPKAMVSLHIVYDDKSMYDVTIPVIETESGKGAVVELSPSVGNYSADLGYYSSLTVKVKALQYVNITDIELRKQEGGALKEDVIYQGIQISSQTGITINSKDGTYQATFNSSRFEMKAKKNGTLQRCIYFDTASGKYKITGDVTIDGLVTITNGLANGTTTINGGCIKTGTISAARLDLSGVASISSLANGTTTINGGCIKTGTISAARLDLSGVASISSLANGTTTINGGCIKTGTISAAHLDLSGVASISSLANGTTTINGGCIKTGTISAARLNLTGAIEFGDLNGDVQGRINNSANPSYIHSTYISSTEIRSPTISAGNFLGARFKSSDGGNWIEMGANSGSAWLKHFSTLYSSSTPVCTMGYSGGRWVLAPFNKLILLYYPNGLWQANENWLFTDRVSFSGTVDFSKATVVGL